MRLFSHFSKSARDRRRPQARNTSTSLQSNRRSNVEGLEQRRLLSVNPQLIRDIHLGNTGETFGEFDGYAYFHKEDATNGLDLWRTDGTAGGTSIVADLFADTFGQVHSFAATDDHLFFVPDQVGNSDSPGLFRTDGTAAGTELLTFEFTLFVDNRGPEQLTVVGDDLFFTLSSDDDGRELWVSDGTPGGTDLVVDLSPGDTGGWFPTANSTSFNWLTNFNDSLLFGANGKLYESDGTAAGTQEIVSVGSLTSDFAHFDGSVFFTVELGSNGRALWKTDGTAAGTELVTNFLPGDDEFALNSLTPVGNTLYFTADDGVHGVELWKSDGTAVGTELVADIVTGPSGSSPEKLTSVGGSLFFVVDDGVHGTEVWTSDGTAAGTQMVADLAAGEATSNPTELIDVDGTLFFAATTSDYGRELWSSDGTGVGTQLVADLNPGTSGSLPQRLAAFGNQVLFTGYDALSTRHLFISDGSSIGTTSVSTLLPAQETSRADDFVPLEGVTYFSAGDGINRPGLYRTDGTPEGTLLIRDFGPTEVGVGPSKIAPVGNKVVYVANQVSTGRELWISDGTVAGTTLLIDIVPGPGSPNFKNTAFIPFQNQVFIRMSDGTLWHTDGTTAGTSEFEVPGEPGFEFDAVLPTEDFVFFVRDDNTTWMSDGTPTGTTQLFDMNSDPVMGGSFGGGSRDDGGLELAPMDSSGTILFTAETATHGGELWRTDGTAAGTYLVKDINSGTTSSWPSELTIVDDIFYFLVNDGTGKSLWRSDGTELGTYLVKQLPTQGAGEPNPERLTALGNQLFFTLAADGFGNELWVSDGTEAGTTLFKDIGPGTSSGNPRHLNVVGDKLYFKANDNIHGEELWVTDGTESGTMLLHDLNPGEDDSEVNNIQLFSVKDALIFMATDGTTGDEPWLINLSTNQAPQADAGGSYTVPVGGSVLLDASASFDPDLDEDLSYFWDVNGDGDFRDAAGKTVTLDWAALNALGISETNPLTQVSVRVSDGIGGASNSAAVSLTVVTESADIGGPYFGDEGSLIALTGAASEGATLYEWDLDNDGQFDDATGENVNFNATDNGVFTIGLRINGAGGPTDSTTVSVNNVAPTASISGTTDIYRGETVTFTLGATDPSPIDQAGLFTFEIDWDGNGTVDETLLNVVTGTTVQHTFGTVAAGNIQVRATDKDAATGSFSQTPITVSPHVLRDDGFGNTDLIWGGTPSIDAVFFLGSPTTLAMFAQYENLIPVNRLDVFGSAVTGKIIVHTYGGGDVVVGELVSGIALEVHGGEGDDVLVGGMLGDELYGDGGNDIILGGTQAFDEADLLFGGDGKDTLFGHYGADFLNGGGGEDLLISDQLSFSDVSQAVLQIGEEWKSARPFAERVSNILGVTSTGVNGTSILSPGVTVIDDGAPDTLFGGLGELDWLFYDFDQDLLGEAIEPGEEETDSDP